MNKKHVIENIIFFAIVFGIIGVIVGVVFLYHYSFPKEIDVQHQAVIFTDNGASAAKQTTIHITGTLHRPLFRQDKFNGKVTIDAIDSTKDQAASITVVEKKHGIYEGSLLYEGGQPLDFKVLGLMWFDKSFQNINLWIGDREWLGNAYKNQNALFLTTGADYSQAVETQRLMGKKFGKGFVPK